MANCVAIDGPPGPSMAAMDGPLCRKWSPTSKPAQGGQNYGWNILTGQSDCLVTATVHLLQWQIVNE